jgi:hypothetical protein
VRSRERVLQSLDNTYRTAFAAAEAAGDTAGMARLDLEYQREQLHLEVMLDIRDLLMQTEGEKPATLIEKAQQLRRLTRFVP